MKCQWCQTNDVVQHDSFFYLIGLEKSNQSFCQQCLQTLFTPIQRENSCLGCGRSGSYSNYCKDCERWMIKEGSLKITNRALFEYNAQAKEWISRYKFMGDCRLANMMKLPLQKVLRQVDQCYFVPLPSSKNSLSRRQFDAVRYLLEVSKIPYLQVLQHIGKGKKQSEKTRAERLQLEQPFTLIKRCNFEFVKIVLIDDVYTTGATLHKAAECLLEHDKKLEIQSITLFR